jgi:CheY-like chemotaxis protein
MVRLIDDLLDISRITLDKLELRKSAVELAPIVHHAVEACRPLIERAGHELSIDMPDEPVYLTGDSARLAQVFGNLLTNACKYTERGGRIGIIVTPRGTDVAVSINDNGMGIPQNMLPQVFDMFVQIGRTIERTEGGLGIGLSLAKRLVEMHGGTLTVQSDGPGRGSQFTVCLPTLPESFKQPALDTKPPESANAAHRILVVDDNRDSAESLAILLRLAGNELQLAYDGVEAVEKAAVQNPDIIVLDIGLPRMNGYDACRAIRAQPGGKDITIIAASGWAREEDRRMSKEAGFDAHLAKPADPRRLLQMMADELQPESVSKQSG